MEKEILVVKRETLFADYYFQGFLPHTDFDYQQIILNEYEYLKRGLAEVNSDFQQPIAYCIICNEKNELFAYQRASKKEQAAEERLHGKWSLGIGGHIDKEDQEQHPVYTSLLRELEEELGITSFERITPLGYINDESNAVGKVHFGLLYLVKIADINLRLAKEIAQGSFISFEQLETMSKDDDYTIEEWSQIAIPPLKNYLESIV